MATRSDASGAGSDSESEASEDGPTVPVTIITGFLGAGKSTLLMHLLTEMHGMRFAVIENEFGAVGVDDAIVKEHTPREDQIVEMLNGCVCCTVRADLAKAVKRLLARSDDFDAIIVETTGMADPAPVVQTFMVDKEVSAQCFIDGIVTVVDAKHVMKRLDEKKPDGAINETLQQIAFADVVLLNKVDLVSAEELGVAKQAIAGINQAAKVIVTERSKVAPKELIDIQGFDLARVEDFQPGFLAKDKPDESKEGEPKKGDGHGHGHGHAHGHAHGHGHGHGHGHSHASPHDRAIGSLSFQYEGDLALPKMEAWIKRLIDEKSEDLFRYKGVFAVAGMPERYVFQGVHMLFEGAFSSPWKPGEARLSRFVFIGKDLDKAALTRDFEACKAYDVRFDVGDAVEFNAGGGNWCAGEVEATWSEGFPYKVRPDGLGQASAKTKAKASAKAKAKATAAEEEVEDRKEGKKEGKKKQEKDGEEEGEDDDGEDDDGEDDDGEDDEEDEEEDGSMWVPDDTDEWIRRRTKRARKA